MNPHWFGLRLWLGIGLKETNAFETNATETL
jgi:hypothetical protein